MRISNAGLELIKEFEGFSSKPYQDSVGVWTIGFGHTSDVSAKSKKITKAGGEIFLMSDVVDAQEAIERYVKVELNQNQFDALVSFIFNLGAGAFRRSTLLRRINAEKFDEVPTQLMRWNWAGKKKLRGLTRRRAAEAALWSTPAKNEPVYRGEILPDTPDTFSKENIGWGVGMVSSGTMAMSNIPQDNSPISYAIAIVIVLGFLVGAYYWLSRRKA